MRPRFSVKYEAIHRPVGTARESGGAAGLRWRALACCAGAGVGVLCWCAGCCLRHARVDVLPCSERGGEDMWERGGEDGEAYCM